MSDWTVFVCNPMEALFRQLEEETRNRRPEDDWTNEMIREDATGVGCSCCGNEEAETVHGLCDGCDEIRRLS